MTRDSHVQRPSLLFISLCLGLAGAATDTALAQDRDQDRGRTQLRDQDRDAIYGSQLMTQQERIEYRNRMRELRTAQEQEQFRREHHERMQERARARGLQLPSDPPAQAGRRLHQGAPMGAGPGPGVGGPGAGAGRAR